MRANGRTDAGTDWALRREVDGYIEANGRAVSKVGTGCGRASRLRPGMRERGQVVSRTVTDRRRTQMEVSFGGVCFLLLVSIRTKPSRGGWVKWTYSDD